MNGGDQNAAKGSESQAGIVYPTKLIQWQSARLEDKAKDVSVGNPDEVHCRVADEPIY